MVSAQAVLVGTPSLLPAAIFLTPIAAGALILLAGIRRTRVCQGITLLTAATMLAMAVAIFARVARGEILVGWGNELRVDGLSAALLLVITVVGLAASVYSVTYLLHDRLMDRVGVGRAEHRFSIFHALFVWFLGTMTWAVVTNNVIMLYVAVEATTLASGLLVAFYWDRKALEAGYKYLMLLTVGITFALFGCVMIYAGAAATGALSGGDALQLSRVRDVAHLIPRRTALITVSLLLVGFGMKAGLAPFHPWLPDAHAEAPTPVSVLLSGVMIKVAIYALARTVNIFFPALPVLTVFGVALGVFTMILGVLLALSQDDLKRLLAYSSVSQMGYVLAGLALGSYLGAFGGLFHLLNHALFKALLFMAAGAIIFATGARRVSQLGALSGRMPITTFCFFVGALSIAGFPPFNGFWSKLTVYLALADAGMWWAAALAVLASVLTMVALIRPAYRIFWGPAPDANDLAIASAREVPAGLWVPMLTIAALCLLLGVLPGLASGLLHRGALLLATVGG